MRLRRLDLTRYGKFTNHAIDFGERVAGMPDLHVVYGLNEAGKSTALCAYLDLLFGIEERTRYDFLHSYKLMEIGGCLEFGGQSHELKRIKQRSNSLLDAQNNPVGEALLGAPLAGLTRSSYQTMFSLDDDTLKDGGNAILQSEGDLGEMLFSATSGLAGISAVLTSAGHEAGEIFRKRASSTRIARLKHEIVELKARRDAIDTQASAHAALVAAHTRAVEAYQEATGERRAVAERVGELTRLLRASPLSADLDQVCRQIEAFRDLPRPPASWTAEISKLIDEETRAQTRATGLDQQETRVKAELEALVVDDGLLAIADRLDGLAEAAARYSTAEEDLPKRRAALAERSQAIALILATLGRPDTDHPAALVVSTPTIATLRDLIAERSGIDVACESAAKEHGSALRLVEEAKAERDAPDGDTVTLDAVQVAHLQSMIERIRQGGLAAQARLAERGLPGLRAQFDNAVAPLHPWAGDGEDLRRLILPTVPQVEAWRARLASLDKRIGEQAERVRDLRSRRSQATVRIEAIKANAGSIGDDEAQAAFAAREEAWKRHLATMDHDTAVTFEARMRSVDQITSDRLSGAKELAELRSLTGDVTAIDASIELQAEVRRQLDDAFAIERDAILAAMTALPVEIDATGSPAGWLDEIERWQRVVGLAIPAWDALHKAENDLKATRGELEEERLGLARALAAIGIDGGALPISSLVHAAENVLDEQAAARLRQAEENRRIKQLERGLADRNTALDAALAARDDWQRRWTDALRSTWFVDRVESVGAVRELVEVVATLPEALRIQSEIEHRIEAMEHDREAFAAAVEAIHATLGERFDMSAPLQAARMLARRREKAEKAQAKRQDRQTELQRLAHERQALSDEVAAQAVRAREMTGLFRVETLTEVRRCLDQCAARDRLAADRERLEREIAGEMRQPSIDEALAMLRGLDLPGLQSEHDELSGRLEDMDEHIKIHFAAVSAAKDKLDAIGGDDAVARIDAERRTVLVELEDQALRFLRLRTGTIVAEEALRAYRDTHRNSMMKRASDAFSLMTRREYTGLATRPEKDREVLIGLSRHGGSKLATEMSKGTQFQLYLALRLAGYEEFSALRPPVPFIADDIMETFDEPRSEEVFRLLGGTAGLGQVIYLTHHRHLCEIARKVVPGVKVHEIPQ